MELLNKVKDILEQKGYDFSDEKWQSGELLTILYDAGYATEQAMGAINNPKEPTSDLIELKG